MIALSVVRIGVLLAVFVVIAGCGLFGRKSSSLVLPPTAAFTDCEQYAVVTAAHLSLHSDAIRTADVVYLSRRGEVLSIIDKDISQKEHYNQQAPWYLLSLNGERGWGFGTLFTTYCYRYQAELQQQLLRERYGQ